MDLNSEIIRLLLDLTKCLIIKTQVFLFVIDFWHIVMMNMSDYEYEYSTCIEHKLECICKCARDIFLCKVKKVERKANDNSKKILWTIVMSRMCIKRENLLYTQSSCICISPRHVISTTTIQSVIVVKVKLTSSSKE